MLTSDLTSLDLPQFSQCMDASEENWHRLVFIYLFFLRFCTEYFFFDRYSRLEPSGKKLG